MTGRDKSIAVFDSGVGGLTVLRALRAELPSERLIYFGDTARVPYGSKSKEAVTRFSLEVASFLVARSVKLLVVACNTASSLALPRLKAEFDVPVLGVIAPAVRAAAAATRSRRVGVIGTEATVASQAYQRSLQRWVKRARVTAVAAPLLVPLVEEGWWSHSVTAAVARHYLEPIARARVDVLILGCTHYPLLAPLLGRLAGPGVRLIDSARETAREARSLLEDGDLLREGRGSEEFFVSDSPRRFLRLASRFLGAAGPGRVRVVRFA